MQFFSYTRGMVEDEFTFRDLSNGTGIRKVGDRKINFGARQATLDGLQFF
jgi:hypothetical protein